MVPDFLRQKVSKTPNFKRDRIAEDLNASQAISQEKQLHTPVRSKRIPDWGLYGGEGCQGDRTHAVFITTDPSHKKQKAPKHMLYLF